jgi:hypothetical protein
MIDAKTLSDARKAYGVIMSGTATEAELLHADNFIDRLAERCGVPRSEIAAAVESEDIESATSTEIIRETVRQFAPSETATWPNGLGFSWRGWEYMCRSANRWTASRNDKIGHGGTPADARSTARKAN